MPYRPKKNKHMTEPAKVDEKMVEVSQKIQAALEGSGYALQPFLSFSEYGVTPRVRLVKMPQPEVASASEVNSPNSETNDNGANQADTTETQDGDAATETA